MTNKSLRQALLKKIKITSRGLLYRVQKIKKNHSMTTEDAICVIAQREGIILDKYLDKDTVDRVRGIIQDISSVTEPQPRTIPTRKEKVKTSEGERVIVIAKEFRGSDPILPQGKLSEAKEMAAIYPLLYILENSIREVIDRVMTAKYGDSWWDTKAPRGLKDTVSKRMADEKKNAWHQRRGSRPVDYLDLDQLPALMRKIEKEVVPNIIPSMEWFNQLIQEVYQSRCVVCHMNPLDSVNIQSVKVRVEQWQRQIEAKKGLI